MIVHVPHSSRTIPPDVRAGIRLDDTVLQRELDLLTDAFTDVIAERAAERAGARPWLLVNQLSRYVVDPERFPDEREELNAVGMGAVYTRTTDGEVFRSDRETPGLVDRFFTPYSAAFESLTAECLSRHGRATIIDLHSYPLAPNPYELHADGPRPQVCLGTDDVHTPPHLVDAASGAFASFELGQDSPFIGTYVPTRFFSSEPAVESIMIELRRDLFVDDQHRLVESRLPPIIDALTALIDTLEARP